MLREPGVRPAHCTRTLSTRPAPAPSYACPVAAEAVYLISGIPGAGKTSVARALASRFARGAHIESDRIQDLIVSGGLHPQEEPEAEAERQLRLRTRNVCLLADSFFAASVTPIVDCVVVSRARLDDFLAFLRSRPIFLVQLAPELEVAADRDARRAEKSVLELWRHLDVELREQLPGVGLWLDTSELSPEETVEVILERVWSEGAVA